MDNVLEVRDLSVRFGRLQALTSVSFTVARGASLAIIGPNGAGKTVLFKALIGALAHEGTVTWTPGARIGYVPQKLDLERGIPITGWDFLRARIAIDRQRSKAPESSPGVSDALALVGVAPEAAELPIGSLSGGQFQRLLIAFALLGNPNVLMLDEPTAGIDAPGQDQLNALVRRLRRERGLTVLFISHELSIVSRDATDVLCLSNARTWMGPPVTILTPSLLHEVYGLPVDYHVHDH